MVGPRTGQYKGMPARREFHAVRVVEGRAVGVAPVDGPDHVIVCESPFQGEAQWQ
jgi:hypothetical protein